MSRFLLCLAFLSLAFPAQAQKQETIDIGGERAFLHVPPNPRASAVLVPGQAGITQHNALLRNRAALNARGIATLTVPHEIVLREAIRYLRGIQEPVALIAMSAGVSFAARGIVRGSRPDTLVLISGSLMTGTKFPAKEILKSPSALPPTLILHNRNDRCRLTPPSGVEPFVKWSGGKARVIWIGGAGPGDPCGSNSAHGFVGADRELVDAIVSFVAR